MADAVPPPYSVRGLPTGHYLIVSHDTEGRVLEVNGEGKTVWQHPVAGAGGALRLRNRNTLIAGPGRVTETDPRGKTVSEVHAKGDRLSLRECFGLLRLGFDR